MAYRPYLAFDGDCREAFEFRLTADAVVSFNRKFPNLRRSRTFHGAFIASAVLAKTFLASSGANASMPFSCKQS